MKTTQVIIVDDHPMVREGLRGMLATDRAIQVVGEATTGVEAVELVGRISPDVVLMDIRMPDMDGLAATRQIKQEHPEVSVIMVTMYDNPDYLFQAVSAGAAGYVLKDVSRFELLQTIRTVMSGGSFLNSDLMTQCLQRLASHGRPAGQEAAGAPERLTPREMDVLKLVTEGLSNKEIAARLIVSVATVKTHVEHIIQKLQVSDRTQAAVAAVTRGLLS